MSSIEIIVVGTPQDIFPSAEVFSPVVQQECASSHYGIFSALDTAWKNSEAEYIGFCTAKEYLSFSGIQHGINASGCSNEPYLSNTALARYALDDTINIAQAISGFDLLVSSTQDQKKGTPSFSSVNDRLKNTFGLAKEDLQDFLSLVRKNYPHYESLVDAYGKGVQYRSNSLFVMKSELFDEYCSMLFGLYDSFF